MAPAAWGACCLAVALTVYVRSCYPTVAGGDAGELSHLACSLGVAHPPGYPLMVWGSRAVAELLKLAGVGRREGEEGERVLGALGGNLLSCLCGASACWIGMEACRRWYSSRGYANALEMAGAQAALIAFSPLLWQYYVQNEVFSLNNLFVSVQLLLSQIFLESCEKAKRVKGKEKDKVQEQLRLQAWSSSVLGAFFAGLGFSNQHTIVFYTLPIVCFVLYHDFIVFKNTQRASYWCALVLAFVAGLSPYLLLILSSTSGALGSWGDQTTMTGLITHLLRREYGTFRLYAGEDMEYTSVLRWALLYSQDFAENFLWVGLPLLLVGSVATLRSAAHDSFGLLLLLCFTFYWVSFHLLANIPSSDPLMLGVHKRFWIQAHLVGSMLIMPGLAALHELLLGRKLHLPRWVSGPCVLLVLLLQAGLHFSKNDQSSNRYMELYARSILEPLPLRAIILSKGDNIANTVRYLQVCEHVRQDVRLMDQNMMCYPWFKKTQSRFFPGVIFPGEHCEKSPGEGEPGSYSIREFLDANYREEGPPILTCGGWRQNEAEAVAFKAVQGYTTIPYGLCEKVIPLAALPNVTVNEVMEDNKILNAAIKEKDGNRSSGIISVWKELDKYDETTWERSIHVHTLQSFQKLGHWLVMWAQRNEDDVKVLRLAIKFLSRALAEWPEVSSDPSAMCHRIRAITCSRLINKKALSKGQQSTKAFMDKQCNWKSIISDLKVYVDKETKLSTEVEKQIIEAYRSHPYALIDLRLDE